MPASLLPGPPSSTPKQSSSSGAQHITTDPTPLHLVRLPQDEESVLLSESQSLKATATASFTSADLTSAVDFYTRALTPLPSYCHFELAVLHANIAACHLRLGEWKEANDAAGKALEELEQVDAVPKTPDAADGNAKKLENAEHDSTRVTEVDDALEVRIAILHALDHSLSDVHKLRIKALLRRSKARSEIGTWAELQGAMEDYTALSKSTELSATDRKTVQGALQKLPARLNQAKDKEVADMMGKLKGLGNGLLKPFGLSTDNFQFVKDEKTGGYNMNFNR